MKKKTKKHCESLAEKHGGKCLSEKYNNAHTKLQWECSQGHKWVTTYASVKRGSWCPMCAGRPKITLDDCRKLAEERGGKLLGLAYINNSTPVVWRCAKGHEWKASFGNVKRGSWCPRCGGRIK